MRVPQSLTHRRPAVSGRERSALSGGSLWRFPTQCRTSLQQPAEALDEPRLELRPRVRPGPRVSLELGMSRLTNERQMRALWRGGARMAKVPGPSRCDREEARRSSGTGAGEPSGKRLPRRSSSEPCTRSTALRSAVNRAWDARRRRPSRSRPRSRPPGRPVSGREAGTELNHRFVRRPGMPLADDRASPGSTSADAPRGS